MGAAGAPPAAAGRAKESVRSLAGGRGDSRVTSRGASRGVVVRAEVTVPDLATGISTTGATTTGATAGFSTTGLTTGASTTGATTTGASTTGATTTGATAGFSTTGLTTGASTTGATALAAAFLTGFSSSTTTSRTRPANCALRLSIGTKASTSVDCGVLAATLLALHNSNISAFVMPSDFAKSLTLTLLFATRRSVLRCFERR